jgi:tetratricopeptide (TPR) repeat protein
VLRSLALLALLGIAAPAAAQSRRYPPDPVDKDAEAARSSGLWSAAVTPERHPYQDLVRDAADALNRRTGDQTLEAIKKLDLAIRLLPREPEAHRLRGDAYLDRKDWAKCADDYAAADAGIRRDAEPPKAMVELHRKLGLCQARAGKLADAERTLAETAASGNASGEIWMRLGEVRIAMGKLDEAIAALSSALEATETGAQPLIHFLLATAYDRARRPADALLEASQGLAMDRQLTTLLNPSLPPLGPGELDYMLALAYSAEPVHPEGGRPESARDLSRPELALVYFRRFIAAAPDSPWRRRADDHLRELRAGELPDTMVHGGSAALDTEAARSAARRQMPQMRACLAKFPLSAVELEITRSGPRTPPADRLKPRFFTPPDGVTVRVAVGEIADRELDAVDRCLEAQANRLALPAAREHDTYYKVMFYVVGP